MFFFKRCKRFMSLACFVIMGFLLTGCKLDENKTDSSVINIMSYNMRFERINKPDPVYPWSTRIHGIVKSFNDYNAHIVGTQELETWQYDQLMEMLDERWDGFGESRFLSSDEKVAIIYRKDIFDVSDQKTLWLSETPEKVGSKSWGTAHPRIVTFAKFKNKVSGFEFLVFNTHLDHVSAEAREKGLELIDDLASQYDDLPIFITGDFNMTIDDKSFEPFTNSNSRYLDSFSKFPEKFAENSKTTHGFNGGTKGKAIDFIFYTKKDFDLLETIIVHDKYENRFYLSDHYPVFSSFKIIEEE